MRVSIVECLEHIKGRDVSPTKTQITPHVTALRGVPEVITGSHGVMFDRSVKLPGIPRGTRLSS